MSVFNHPTQKVKRFRAKPMTEIDWIAYKTVRVEISVGRNYHEGNRLQATLDWARNNFEHVVVLLGDTLQRYNLMMDGIGVEQAYQKSLQAGNEWLKRNCHMLHGMTILRWDNIIQHADFAEARKKIDMLYDENGIVRDEIRKAMDEVALRRDVTCAQSKIFYRLSQNYLLEEIAAAAIANRLYPGVSAYPGQLPNLWNVMHDIPLHNVPLGLENARNIELKIYKK